MKFKVVTLLQEEYKVWYHACEHEFNLNTHGYKYDMSNLEHVCFFSKHAFGMKNMQIKDEFATFHSRQFKIVNEEKYAMFLLRYS